MKLQVFKKGMKDGIPIMLGYFAVSFTFGMMAVQGGESSTPEKLPGANTKDRTGSMSKQTN